MALFVEIDGDWHRVESYQDRSVPNEDGSASITRQFELGCGQSVEARGDRMEEAETEPGGPRHIAKGCFKAQAKSS